MATLECQLAQGCEGDLIVLRGHDADGKLIPVDITCETTIAADGKTRWLKGGKRVHYSGEQFWWSKHEPFFKEKLDTRGKDDPASPLGEWTKVECICKGDRITVKINGVTVNEAHQRLANGGQDSPARRGQRGLLPQLPTAAAERRVRPSGPCRKLEIRRFLGRNLTPTTWRNAKCRTKRSRPAAATPRGASS